MEPVIAPFKTELIEPRRPWKTLSHAELGTAERVDWYNHRRLHGKTGHLPPVEYEANYYQETAKPQVTATIWDLHQTRGGSSIAVMAAWRMRRVRLPIRPAVRWWR
ncbi:hypothetical protein B4N89_46375 [Embleya scabrispora]|uniref:Integrase catalytic domain-containing protein n=1 Tax=Embleya scabrispora TaxID=159449 RepID=A0A1T3NIQ7_9ACTN|nr:integrase core domain-containing protein [Embleya scabrispora]OPC76471.1 hypothetical protein B4N89_46375 [Embleya scabrispora]